MSATEQWNNFIYKHKHAHDNGIMFTEEKETPASFFHMIGQKYKVCVCMKRDIINVARCLNVKVLSKNASSCIYDKNFFKSVEIVNSD